MVTVLRKIGLHLVLVRARIRRLELNCLMEPKGRIIRIEKTEYRKSGQTFWHNRCT